MNALRLFFNAQLSTLNVQRSTLDTRRIMWSAVTNAVRHRFPVCPHKAASRGIPLAAALQNFSTLSKKPSCPLCLCVRQQQRHANLRTLERPNFRTSSPAFTLIELVAALSLFVVILGILMTVLNSATDLWSASRSQKRETHIAASIMEQLADDLVQAVTDNAGSTNDLSSVQEHPCFILASPPTNATPNDVVVLLAFARHGTSRVAAPDSPGEGDVRLSLDAVFYTYYRDALFRHVIPLYNDFNDPQPLGTLLHDLRASAEDTSIHDKILDMQRDPSQKPGVDWSYLLLAERVIPSLQASLADAFLRKTDNAYQRVADTREIGDGLFVPPVYDRLTTDVLPDQVDFALHLFDAQDWSAYQEVKQDSSSDAQQKRRHLGVLHSKRITFPAQGGSRLP
jgi:type II secretory pathway pseudopilin PulG